MATHTWLRLDNRAATLSNRTLNALRNAGILTWDELVTEAQRTPNVIGHMAGLGPKGVSEIKTALATAKVETTFRTGARQ